MKRAYQAVAVVSDIIEEHGTDVVRLPPATWYLRGPRGGRYLATGERSRFVWESPENYMRGMVTVVDRAEEVRYIRPGTRAAREFDAQNA